MSNLYYFASDGSYGQWDALAVLVDVSEWTNEDWQEIDEAGDSFRASIAYRIAMEHRQRRESPF